MPLDSEIRSSKPLNDGDRSAPSLISASASALVERTPAASNAVAGEAKNAQQTRRHDRKAVRAARLRARSALV
jgi:hypothetical protein